MTRLPRKLSALIPIMFAFALPACGGDETTVEIGEDDITIRREGELVHVEATTDRGNTVEGSFGEGAVLPDDFPSDVPIYPGASVGGSMSARGEGRMLTLRSDDAPDEVLGFYRGELEAQGWSIQNEMNLGAQRMLVAEKAGRTTSIQIAQDDDATGIVLTVSED